MSEVVGDGKTSEPEVDAADELLTPSEIADRLGAEPTQGWTTVAELKALFTEFAAEGSWLKMPDGHKRRFRGHEFLLLNQVTSGLGDRSQREHSDLWGWSITKGDEEQTSKKLLATAKLARGVSFYKWADRSIAVRPAVLQEWWNAELAAKSKVERLREIAAED
jgi:hypothetical protein